MTGSIRKLAEQSLPAAGTLFRAGLDFLYPCACPLCRRDLHDQPPGAREFPALCDDCCRLLFASHDICRRCGAPVGPHLETTHGCLHCHRERYAFETAVALGAYERHLRDACLRAKGKHSQPLAAALGTLLWKSRGEIFAERPIDLVVPVPHHWTETLAGRHNTAGTIARRLARTLHVPGGAPILAKVRRTPRQASLPATRRRSNLRGAFRVRRGVSLEGRSVLLVDDILTTGTTAHEATKALRKAGAAHVVVAVVARGLGRQQHDVSAGPVFRFQPF